MPGIYEPFADEFGYQAFWDAIEKHLAEGIKGDNEKATAFWCAMANVAWRHEKLGVVSYSFRQAGQLITEIQGTGHYMDWYMCGPAETVSEEIAEALGKEGWKVDQSYWGDFEA